MADWTRCPDCGGELRFPAPKLCPRHASYQKVYVEARTEMSDAIEELLVRHLGMDTFGGWEARVMSLAMRRKNHGK